MGFMAGPRLREFLDPHVPDPPVQGPECVCDPVAGDYFVISAPGAGRGACPWGWCLTLCCSFEICSPLWFL